MLLVHGEADATCPIKQSTMLYDAMKKAGFDVAFERVPGMGHEAALVVKYLRQVVAKAAAAFSNGAPGWAIRAAADPLLIEESASIVEQAASWIESTDFERVATALAMSDALARQRTETLAVIEATAGLWRDSMLVRSGNSDRIVYRAHSELTDHMAGSYELSELLTALSSVWTCLNDVRINVRPRLALESMVLSWPRMPARR